MPVYLPIISCRRWSYSSYDVTITHLKL